MRFSPPSFARPEKWHRLVTVTGCDFSVIHLSGCLVPPQVWFPTRLSETPLSMLLEQILQGKILCNFITFNNYEKKQKTP